MEDMIRKSEVMNRLNLMKMTNEMDHRIPANKRKIILGCVSEMMDLVNEIGVLEKLEEVSQPEPVPDENPGESDQEEQVRKWQKDRYLEPVMTGSNIGVYRFHCGKCRKVVGKNDKFCRHCGVMFGETIEHNNTKWDTETNREVS